MWVLEGTIDGSPFSKVLTLKLGNSNSNNKYEPFVIGRTQGNLLFSKDRRTSRTHCHIYMTPIKRANKNMMKVTIVDLSKFGTTVNGNKISKNVEVEIKHNDSVCVGQPRSCFNLLWKPFVVCTSRIVAKEKKMIEQSVNSIGKPAAIAVYFVLLFCFVLFLNCFGVVSCKDNATKKKFFLIVYVCLFCLCYQN